MTCPQSEDSSPRALRPARHPGVLRRFRRTAIPAPLERSQRLGCMTGVSWFFVALVRPSREHGGGELHWWDSQQETAQFMYDYSGRDLRPRPDGTGIRAEHGRDIAFLLEYGTGTEHLPQLAAKLTSYAEQARMPVGLAFRMPVLFCFPTFRCEQTARQALAAKGAVQALHIATAALDPRDTCPACGPTWMPLHGGYGPMRLVDLGDALLDPWRVGREQQERERREQERREMDPDRL